MLKDRMNCIYLCLNSIYNINPHPNKVTSITSQVTTTKKAMVNVSGLQIFPHLPTVSLKVTLQA